MNFRTRFNSAQITWHTFDSAVHRQQQRARVAKDAHDDHSIGRNRVAGLHPSMPVFHPRETYNLEWQRLAALKRWRLRQSIRAFFKPRSS